MEEADYDRRAVDGREPGIRRDSHNIQLTDEHEHLLSIWRANHSWFDHITRSEKNATTQVAKPPCFPAFAGQPLLHFFWDGP
jgi:hypothetical protein